MSRLASLDKPTAQRSASEDRARDVLLTAADLFYRQGFDATSMSEIANAMDLTKAGLYYYTKGKEDLLYKIMDFAMTCVERDIVEPARLIDAPESRLKFVIENHLKAIFDTGGALTILTVESGKLPSGQLQGITDRKRAYLNLVRKTLTELKKLGRLRKLDVNLASLNMFANILGVTRWYQPDGRFSRNRVISETSRFILSALLVDFE